MDTYNLLAHTLIWNIQISVKHSLFCLGSSSIQPSRVVSFNSPGWQQSSASCLCIMLPSEDVGDGMFGVCAAFSFSAQFAPKIESMTFRCETHE